MAKMTIGEIFNKVCVQSRIPTPQDWSEVKRSEKYMLVKEQILNFADKMRDEQDWPRLKKVLRLTAESHKHDLDRDGNIVTEGADVSVFSLPSDFLRETRDRAGFYNRSSYRPGLNIPNQAEFSVAKDKGWNYPDYYSYDIDRQEVLTIPPITFKEDGTPSEDIDIYYISAHWLRKTARDGTTITTDAFPDDPDWFPMFDDQALHYGATGMYLGVQGSSDASFYMNMANSRVSSRIKDEEPGERRIKSGEDALICRSYRRRSRRAKEYYPWKIEGIN